MKEIVEYLSDKNIVCKSLKEITPKELGSRKRVKIYIGVDLKGYYTLIITLDKKSRVVTKEANELLELHTRAQKYLESTIKKCYIKINAPLCSKAKMLLKENHWVVWHEQS